MMKAVGIFFTLVCCHIADAARDSYSYHKFSGPVSGQIQEVYVPTATGTRGKTVDFVAKPDYTYSYGIDDPFTGNSQAHEESRNGDNVQGEYRVIQPDGLIRIVRYIADPEKGFQVDVKYAPYNGAVRKDSSEDDDKK